MLASHYSFSRPCGQFDVFVADVLAVADVAVVVVVAVVLAVVFAYTADALVAVDANTVVVVKAFHIYRAISENEELVRIVRIVRIVRTYFKYTIKNKLIGSNSTL